MAARLALICLLAWPWLPPASAGEQGRDQLVHYSLQVSIDEQARTQYAASEAELARGDVLTAVARWRAMLDSSRTDRLIPVRGAFLSVPAAISSLLQAQTPAVQAEYLRITEPLAGRALEEAVENDDVQALWGIVTRFPLTQAATEACEQLAQRTFDAARFAECRLAVDRWLEASPDMHAAMAGRPQMAAWRTVSLFETGDHDQAVRHWTEWEAIIPADVRQVVETSHPGIVVDRPGPDSERDVTEVLPSEETVWSTNAPDVFEPQWTTVLADFEELAHPLFMVARPVVTSRGLLVPGTTHQLLDVTTGRPLWTLGTGSTPLPATIKDAVGSLRLALGESIVSRAAVLNDRVWTVHPLENGRPRQGHFDQLDLHNLSDGQRSRSLKSFSPPGREPQEAKVLGPPVRGHSQVFVPLQSQDQITIAAFDDDLRMRWMTPIGEAGLGLLADSRRRWMPAILDAGGSDLLCATGNGAVTALDPLTGRVKWIHRSERNDWLNAGPPPVSAAINLPRFRMWKGWREPVIGRAGDIVIWAGPETDAILGLDRRTGVVRWSRPRGDGLAVVTSGPIVLIIAEEEIRRLNPADGAPVWSTPIPPPAGSGFLAGGWYVQPLRSRGTVAVRLQNGAAARSVDWNAEILRQSGAPLDEFRSLTWTPAGIIARTPRTTSLHPTIAAAHARSPENAPKPESLAAAGRLAEAEALLKRMPETETSARAGLRMIAQETEGDQFHQVEPPLERLERPGPGSSVDQQLSLFLADRRPETALELLEHTRLAALATAWVESNRKPRLRLRADILAASTILQHAPGEIANGLIRTAPALRTRLDELAKRVATSRPADVPRLLQLFQRSDWGAAKLLDRKQGHDRTLVDARERARLRLLFQSLQNLNNDLAPRANVAAESLKPTKPSVTPWSQQPPIPAQVRPWTSLIDQWPAPFEPRGQTELHCLSVDLRLNAARRHSGMGVVFSGCGQDRPWEIALPRTHRSLGQSADYRQAYGIGPAVLLQSGTGLYGLIPFDAAGDRDATTLWDVSWIDMWGPVSSHSVSFLPRLSDATPGRTPLDVDDFSRPLAQIGPVNAAFFCYREFDRLVCCETGTGRRLWDRRSFPPDAWTVGDETAIVLFSPSAGLIQVLDPLDGSVASERPMSFPASHWRAAIGSVAILRSGALADQGPLDQDPEGPSELSAVDLNTGRTLWKRSVKPAARDLVVGERFAGIVDSQSIQLFDPRDGSLKAQIATQGLPDGASVHTIDDPFALMIGVFGPPAVEQLEPPLMFAGSRRRPYANGLVYALDPEKLDHIWTLPLDRSVFPLDQPRDIPLLVILDAVSVRLQPDLEVREDRIRCFDKRTGRQVGPDLQGQHVGTTGLIIERSQQGGWIDLRTSKGIVRFQFPPDR